MLEASNALDTIFNFFFILFKYTSRFKRRENSKDETMGNQQETNRFLRP
jgi:hypothetical protein